MDSMGVLLADSPGNPMGDGGSNEEYCQVCGKQLTTAAEHFTSSLLKTLDRKRMERIIKTYDCEVTVACAPCFLGVASVANYERN